MNQPEGGGGRGRGRGYRGGDGNRGGGGGGRGNNWRGRGRGHGMNWNHKGNNGSMENLDGSTNGNGRGGGTNHNSSNNGRVGPVFGFQRLYRFLSLPTDEVLMSISRDIKDWKLLLQSDAVKPSNPRNNLHLILQILADKVIAETTLLNFQMEICVATIDQYFRTCIVEQCSSIFVSGPATNRNARPGNSELKEIDKTPVTFMINLLIYCRFIVKKMDRVGLDFLTNVVSTAFGAATAKALTDSLFKEIQEGFQDICTELQSMENRLKEEREAEELKLRRRRLGFTQEETIEMDTMEAPEDFCELPIIPTAQEIRFKEPAFLRPNKTSGAYNDANHYLDVQFRLLREDFMRPLKQGIQDFVKNRVEYLIKKKRMPIGSIRVYPEVQIVNAELVRDATVYKVQLHEDNYKRIRWEKSKRLLTGSLLVFTSDLFSTIYLACVATRNENELKKGIVSVTWEGEGPVWDRDEEYLMVECEVYFEAYRYTLQTLKDLADEDTGLENFHMSKFIVGASSSVESPAYLKNSNDLLRLDLARDNEMYISPLVSDQWPSAENLGLDINQFTAFKAAMTREFCIIQGPPGTGKTFLGLKIAETFLKNLAIWGTAAMGPILVVCYTNHALDQFLEGILKFYDKEGVTDAPVVRVGGRTKSPVLQDHYTLQNVVRRKTRNMPKHFWQVKRDVQDEIADCRNQRAGHMAGLLGLRDLQGIVNFEKLEAWGNLRIMYPTSLWNQFTTPSWLGFSDQHFSSVHFDEDALVRRWFVIKEVGRKTFAPAESESGSKANSTSRADDHDNDDEEDYDLEELMQDRILDDVYAEVDSKQGAAPDMGKFLHYVSGYGVKDLDKKIANLIAGRENLRKEKKLSDQMLQQIEIDRRVFVNRKKFLNRLFMYYNSGRIDLPPVSVLLDEIVASPTPDTLINGLQLPVAMRWSLYFTVVDRARRVLAEKVAEAGRALNKLQKKLREVQRLGDGWVLQHSRVVGMTTTGAAKYNDLVRIMASKVVIVEEAAEVLEAHIVTCITKQCEHLILIGDHRQLRPSTTVYELATKYKLDISLFERMVNNNLNCYQLKTQHRMRPEIANLVVGTVYEELHNSPSVHIYPQVKGLTKNLFFLAHNELERSEADSMSKSNSYEAKFLAALCRYLILQGYSSNSITILTSYTGQMFLLKKCIMDIPTCRGVRVTCVDNFQGEENDIILLSLVRSNNDSKIGFLNIENRVCVALSRARHGLFIVGNMNLLSMKSKIWAQIEEKLTDRGEMGSSLTLQCQVHETITQVQKDNDFVINAPEGGCNQVCGFLLECTHTCSKVCHTQDREHSTYQCKEKCLKHCVNNHPCRNLCFMKCKPCPVIITKKLPQCVHEAELPCHKDPSTYLCPIIVTKTLFCGHETDLPCHFKIEDYVCKVKVQKTLKCGHVRVLECHKDPDECTCKILVEKELVPCGHKQLAECRFSPETVKCKTKIEKTLPLCNHKVEILCCDRDKTFVCREKCPVRLPSCGHSCTRQCHVTDDPNHLNYECKKDCSKVCPAPEGHPCTVKHKCFTECKPCTVKVDKILPCDHRASLPCHSDPKEYECLEVCGTTLPCRHRCQNLCFQPCSCETMVEKLIPECGHRVRILCPDIATQDICSVLVPPFNRSLCGHDVLVPCKFQNTATPTVIMSFCRNPCEKVFTEEGGCGHRCSGNCGDCFQGRFHVKCQENCGKTLVCGHVCDFPCSQSCPPCSKECFLKCEHSECRAKCGTPCVDCSEPCPWRCPHMKCSKRCRELCDREPCNEPCPKQLSCGHPCVGFCGELCPPLCRLCDKTELTEFILYGNEEDEDARFVFLPDCKHTIEVEGLTYWMTQDDGEIGMKPCPRCRTVIRNCRRFNNFIRQRVQDAMLVKKKVFGDQKVIRQIREDIVRKLRWDQEHLWSRNFPRLQESLLDKCVNIVPVSGRDIPRYVPRDVDESTLRTIKFTMDCAEAAFEVLAKARQSDSGLKPLLLEDLLARYRKLFAQVLSRPLPLTVPETHDINRELNRHFDLFQAYLRRSNPRFTDGHTRAVPIYQKIIEIVEEPRPYTGTRKREFIKLLEDLEDLLRTGLGISAEERQQILSAFNMRQGRWFKCPNGHLYVITECGGAMQESVCNECGARIGGGNHRVRDDNQFAPEMDGATAPLWPQ